MGTEQWFVIAFGCFAMSLGIATVLLIGWMNDAGIVSWGDLFTYRRRRRRMREALARGAIACTCRTGRRTVWDHWRSFPPETEPVDVAGWRSVDCSFCGGVGAYMPPPARTVLR